MNRYPRAVVAGAAALALLLPMAPATADDASSPEAPVGPRGTEISLEDLPVEATDVTETDTNLRSTTNEVTVLATAPDGSAEVTKLRTDSSADATTLARTLDAQAGVVAARTTRLRRMATTNPEPLAAKQWNLRMVAAPAAWSVNKGSGVTVAVVDSGVDATHPDLVGRVLPEIDLLPDVQPEAIETGHGTATASLVVGAVNATGMAGVAPQASILPVAALDPSGVGDSSTVARAIVEAANAGARVINLSLGGPDRDPVLDAACKYAFNKGSVLVAAGGNSYEEGNEVQYPAGSPNVVAVASVDSDGYASYFSNTGSHIAVAAPGEDVLAAFPGGTYEYVSGTSFAAPHVSGVVALLAGTNPKLTATQLVQLAERTAQDDVSGNGKDVELGYGTVRADRAVAAAKVLRTGTLPASHRVRVQSFNASPEPIRKGGVATVSVRVQARYPDRVWRTDVLPEVVRIEFRATGTSKYTTIGEVTSGSTGVARLYTVQKKSGTYRAKVLQPDGVWVYSGGDAVALRK